MIIRLPVRLVTLGGRGERKGRLLFLFYFNDLPSAVVNIIAPFDDSKFYRVLNSISLTVFPYKTTGKYSFSETIQIYMYFSPLKSDLSLSECYITFTTDWLWIEVCKNAVSSKIVTLSGYCFVIRANKSVIPHPQRCSVPQPVFKWSMSSKHLTDFKWWSPSIVFLSSSTYNELYMKHRWSRHEI